MKATRALPWWVRLKEGLGRTLPRPPFRSQPACQYGNNEINAVRIPLARKREHTVLDLKTCCAILQRVEVCGSYGPEFMNHMVHLEDRWVGEAVLVERHDLTIRQGDCGVELVEIGCKPETSLSFAVDHQIASKTHSNRPISSSVKPNGCVCETKHREPGFVCGLTFDLSGPWRTAKPAGTGPLEGRVSALVELQRGVT